MLSGRSPSVDDLQALRFTEKVVTEAMRLYPPAWAMGREAVQNAGESDRPDRRSSSGIEKSCCPVLSTAVSVQPPDRIGLPVGG